jgi:hypothetical protein
MAVSVKNPERICIFESNLNCSDKVEHFELKVFRATKTFIFYVPGTTDPVNINYDKKADASQLYWDDNNDYAELVMQINQWPKSGRDIVEIYRDFRWSGDNSEAERKKAGQMLHDFILEKTKSFNNVHNPVEIHLIGHSHGGNVINEYTKIAAANTSFPKTLKIKTIVYLSVPFFKNQAQLDTSGLHKDCKILNVYNDYDFTQRFVANFSMHQMPLLIEKLSTDKALSGAVAKIKDWPRLTFMAAESLMMEANSVNPLKGAAGKALWQNTISVFEDVQELFKSIQEIFVVLNRDHPEFITANILEKLNGIVKTLSDDIDPIIVNLNKRIKSYEDGFIGNSFSISNLISDVASGLIDFLSDINKFIGFTDNPNTEALQSDLISLLDEIILNQIVTFDNTYADPTPQIKGACALVQESVTQNDPYDKCPESDAYHQWIIEMERNETEYENLGQSGQKGPDGARLRAEMIFKMIAQINSVYGIIDDNKKYLTYFKRFLNKSDHYVVDDLNKTLSDIRVQFKMRDRKITHQKDIDSGKGLMEQKGSIGYLAVISHSVSRTRLSKTILDEWYDQFYLRDNAPKVKVVY